MICKYCNTENGEKANFCQNCGQALGEGMVQRTSVRSGRRGAIIISCVCIVVALAIVVGFALKYFSKDPANMIRGTWVCEAIDTETEEKLTYTFTSKGGTNAKDSTVDNVNASDNFDWYITEDNDLIILRSDTECTRYVWNPDYENYKLSSNDYSWYLSGDKLYLSDPTPASGYYVYTK